MTVDEKNIKALSDDNDRLFRQLAAVTAERDRWLGHAGQCTARLGPKGPWNCKECGASCWEYDVDPRCVTRYCCDCGQEYNPGDAGYPLDRVGELDADLAAAVKRAEAAEAKVRTLVNADEDLRGTGQVTPDSARESLNRLVAFLFGKGSERPRFTIPADPLRDDDLRLGAFIRQSEIALASRPEQPQ